MTGYKVALEVYNGPLDLLLFLIRREEIDIYDIPIARITGQYLQYVDMMRRLDPERTSEFLVLAATLMEIKSRVLLPGPSVEEGEEDIVDPRLELVRQLLEYKKYKDAANALHEAAMLRAQKYTRSPTLPSHPDDGIELGNLEIWDLLEAFNRLLEETGRRGAVHEIDVDDTPVALHAADIVDSIERAGGQQAFREVFSGRTRAEMIGLFLALLEMIRQRRVSVSQDRPFGPILIRLLDPTPLDDFADDAVIETGCTEEDAAQSQTEAVDRETAEPAQDADNAREYVPNEADPPEAPGTCEEDARANAQDADAAPPSRSPTVRSTLDAEADGWRLDCTDGVHAPSLNDRDAVEEPDAPK
ncbi:MAG: segregation and condensation protein A [Phycisphaerae bacterium]